MTVRAKLKCTQKEDTVDHEKNPVDGGGGAVTLETVCDGSPENKSFFRYTPWGQFRIGTVNQAAYDQFEVGKEYYVDFTPAE